MAFPVFVDEFLRGYSGVILGPIEDKEMGHDSPRYTCPPWNFKIEKNSVKTDFFF